LTDTANVEDLNASVEQLSIEDQDEGAPLIITPNPSPAHSGRNDQAVQEISGLSDIVPSWDEMNATIEQAGITLEEDILLGLMAGEVREMVFPL